jgi:hypothetical protein
MSKYFTRKRLMEIAGLAEQKKFDSAFNLRYLKNIKFNPGQWEFVDAELKKKPFGLKFKDLAQSKPVVDKAIDAASKEQPAVADMTIVPGKGEYGDYVIEIRDGNYAGLTYIFKALDDAYGKYGSAMGWNATID